MANSRLTRFVMEVAPPQLVSVMRHRTRKMLDTINEEDHRDGINNDHPLSPTSKSSSNISMAAMAVSSSSSSSTAVTTTTTMANSKYFYKGVSGFSIFNN
ncbi:hypothetical protein CCACVL1_18967 [Corchorus capsularis]|uniref:Uncharacterized protein n=1 Tax=Corchorus capsularis TaxID=210143 RepID=A0A1R3HJ75_COCAP|nr:hypothetical protein CCACVL1_18967 [Corchorus capsularis]